MEVLSQNLSLGDREKPRQTLVRIAGVQPELSNASLQRYRHANLLGGKLAESRHFYLLHRVQIDSEALPGESSHDMFR
jgi:hypothetical protein